MSRTLWIDRDLEPMLPHFWTDREDDLVIAREALTLGDCLGLVRVGYALRRAAGRFGFAMLAEIGERLEVAARAGDLAACARRVREYELAIRTTTVMLL